MVIKITKKRCSTSDSVLTKQRTNETVVQKLRFKKSMKTVKSMIGFKDLFKVYKHEDSNTTMRKPDDVSMPLAVTTQSIYKANMVNSEDLTYPECIDIVWGYTKNIDITSTSQIIPMEIIQIVLLYFYDTFKFNIYDHGEGLYFMNSQTVQKLRHSQTSTCIFGEEITSTKCIGFDLYIKWVVCKESFFMGYITSTLDKSITDPTKWLGHGKNKHNSVGIEVYKEYNNFTLSDKYSHYKMLNYSATDNFKQGDIFRLSFDFQNMELIIYHNGFKADTLTLESKALTPAISLRYKYEQIEIVKCGLRLHGL